ncbi:hypothetical protein BH20PSE1_BH20PSE1_14680 [soil metagenome]
MLPWAITLLAVNAEPMGKANATPIRTTVATLLIRFMLIPRLMKVAPLSHPMDEPKLMSAHNLSQAFATERSCAWRTLLM